MYSFLQEPLPEMSKLAKRCLQSVYRYFPFEGEHYSPYVGSYRSFGLRVFQNRNGREEELMCVPDISTDFFSVLHLAQLLTRNQLAPVHLLDVIEDVL